MRGIVEHHADDVGARIVEHVLGALHDFARRDPGEHHQDGRLDFGPEEQRVAHREHRGAVDDHVKMIFIE